MSHKVLSLVLLLLSSIYVGEGLAFSDESHLSKNHFFVDKSDKNDYVIVDNPDESLSLNVTFKEQSYSPLVLLQPSINFNVCFISYHSIRAPPTYSLI
jgi:hypothetical protein